MNARSIIQGFYCCATELLFTRRLCAHNFTFQFIWYKQYSKKPCLHPASIMPLNFTGCTSLLCCIHSTNSHSWWERAWPNFRCRWIHGSLYYYSDRTLSLHEIAMNFVCMPQQRHVSLNHCQQTHTVLTSMPHQINYVLPLVTLTAFRVPFHFPIKLQ